LNPTRIFAVNTETISLPALLALQGRGTIPVYALRIEAKQVGGFAAVSHVRRDADNRLIGYQRPRVQAHIGEIKAYLESEAPVIPNALCIAFDDRARFVPSATNPAFGEFVIDMCDLDRRGLPGLIVDGQQRAAALEAANLESFPMFAIAFIARDDRDQREQFIRVNSTKPLPRSLLHELLPETTTQLSRALQRRRFPAKMVERLNYGAGPFRARIQTSTNPEGTIKDTSVLNMLEVSLRDGILYYLRDERDEVAQQDEMLTLVNNYWAAVKEVFPEAWSARPRQSRLVHGAGIMSMGALMDQISIAHYWSERTRVISTERFAENLAPLAEICHWMVGTGHWEFGRKWNELQNTGKDIRLLTDYLRVQYNRRVWDRRLTATVAQMSV
jgi:DNA sulfur modification protein DndB